MIKEKTYGPGQLARMFEGNPNMQKVIWSLWREYYGLYLEKYKKKPEYDDDGNLVDPWLINKISDDISYALALGQDNDMNGNRSFALGQGLVTKSFMEIVLGAYNLIPEGQNPTEWIPSDLLLTLGNGPDKDHRSNVFEIFKNGLFRFLQAIVVGAYPALQEGQTPHPGAIQYTVEKGFEKWNETTQEWEPLGGDADIHTAMSVVGDGTEENPVKLDGDEDEVPLCKYYRSDKGIKGWYYPRVDKSVVISPTCEAIEFENDETAPARNSFYGTRHVYGARSWLKFQYGTSTEVEQVNHALAVGNLIGLIGGVWRKTIATSLESACTVGFVYELIHSPFAPHEHYFCYCTYGRLNNAVWNVPDFEIGKKYYLSNTVAGAVMIEPETWNEGDIVQYIGTGTKDGLEVNIEPAYVYHKKDIPSVVEEITFINQNITNITEEIKTASGNNHESFLIENTAGTEVTVASSWTVEKYNEQVGEFKAVVMVRNKALNTIITLMNILSFDYSDAVKVVHQNPMLTDANITLTVGVDAGTSKLYATVAGMTADNKRIHLCFERCVLGERFFDLEATMELTLEMAATISAYLNVSATSEIQLDMQAVVSTYHNASASPELQLDMLVITSFYRNLAASSSLILEMLAEVTLVDSISLVDFAVFYNLEAVNDSRELAPTGWRIANLTDWTNLINFYGGESLAGGPMKKLETWTTPNSGTTADSLFKALPAGQRNELGEYSGKLTKAIFWIK